MRMVHNVYFALHDRSDTAIATLMSSCKKYLTNQPGIEFFAVGRLAVDNTRPVNDRNWDVGLHMVFSTPEHQTAYQDDPTHHIFINENKSTWASVRVFDSLID